MSDPIKRPFRARAVALATASLLTLTAVGVPAAQAATPNIQLHLSLCVPEAQAPAPGGGGPVGGGGGTTVDAEVYAIPVSGGAEIEVPKNGAGGDEHPGCPGGVDLYSYGEVLTPGDYLVRVDWTHGSAYYFQERESGTSILSRASSLNVKQGQMLEFEMKLGFPGVVFTDVKAGDPFFSQIQWLADEGISTGSKQANGYAFRPKANVTREAMAAFLFRMKAPLNYAPSGASPFTDVQSGHQFYRQIMWAYENGITTGIRDGGKLKFNPKAPITREAMAAFMYRVYKDDLTATGGSRTFTDVPRSHKFYTHISWMAANGITTGSKQSNGSYQFRPKANTSREATAAFLGRAES